jgi:hypothetical protein
MLHPGEGSARSQRGVLAATVHGAAIHANHQLLVGSIITVTNSYGIEAPARIVAQVGVAQRAFIYGIEFVQGRQPNFLGVSFRFLAAVSLFPRPQGRDVAYSFAGAWTIPVTGEIRSPQLQIGQTTSSAV